MITFLIGLSVGASLGVMAAGVCFASHQRDAADQPLPYTSSNRTMSSSPR